MGNFAEDGSGLDSICLGLISTTLASREPTMAGLFLRRATTTDGVLRAHGVLERSSTISRFAACAKVLRGVVGPERSNLCDLGGTILKDFPL